MEKIQIKFDKRKKTLLIVPAIVLAIPILLLLFMTSEPILPSLLRLAFLGITIIVTGIWVNILFKLKKMMHEEPAIIIDNQGITDASGLWTFGFIPWNEIQSVDSFRAGEEGGSGFITFEPKDLNSIINKQKLTTKLILKYDAMLYGKILVIRTQPLEGHFTPVVEKIKAVWKKNRTQ